MLLTPSLQKMTICSKGIGCKSQNDRRRLHPNKIVVVELASTVLVISSEFSVSSLLESRRFRREPPLELLTPVGLHGWLWNCETWVGYDLWHRFDTFWYRGCLLRIDVCHATTLEFSSRFSTWHTVLKSMTKHTPPLINQFHPFFIHFVSLSTYRLCNSRTMFCVQEVSQLSNNCDRRAAVKHASTKLWSFCWLVFSGACVRRWKSRRLATLEISPARRTDFATNFYRATNRI